MALRVRASYVINGLVCYSLNDGVISLRGLFLFKRNEEDDNRGEICAETCAEKWMSKINGEMNIPRAHPPQKAHELTKAGPTDDMR